MGRHVRRARLASRGGGPLAPGRMRRAPECIKLVGECDWGVAHRGARRRTHGNDSGGGEVAMPFGNEGLQDLVGLAMSGGGFRATLFHLGALWRLNELGYLTKLDRISSVSGGSITTGVLG